MESISIAIASVLAATASIEPIRRFIAYLDRTYTIYIDDEVYMRPMMAYLEALSKKRSKAASTLHINRRVTAPGNSSIDSGHTQSGFNSGSETPHFTLPSFLPEEGVTTYVWNGTSINICIERTKSTQNSVISRKIKLQVSREETDIKTLHRFLNTVYAEYARKQWTSLAVYTARDSLNWELLSKTPLRDAEHMVLPDSAVSAIDSVKKFLDPTMEERHRKLGVNYHKGFLLHGPPGNGKTSFVRALASECKMNVYVIQLKTVQPTFLPFLFRDVPKHNLILIEDIDADVGQAVQAGRLATDSVPAYVPFQGTARGDVSSRMTLSSMLNSTDGIGDVLHGKVIVVTTNKTPESFDAALTRSGRLGTHIHFPEPTDGMLRQLLLQHSEVGSIDVVHQNMIIAAFKIHVENNGAQCLSLATFQEYLQLTFGADTITSKLVRVTLN